VFPKIGDPSVSSAMAKIQSPKTVAHYITRNAEHPIYWVRVPGYFCQFFLYPPTARPEAGGEVRPRGELNAVLVMNAKYRRAVHAILNSSTYYAFFCVHTDGRHINPSDVRDFPLTLEAFEPVTLNELDRLSESLARSLNSNVTVWRKSGLLITAVQISRGACSG
jgi:hypothetical protein